ncbi:cobyrinate a,c-diamide synthase [Mycobacterium tuberculosis]|nr:cobyrinate a,c-diamide synthase [Mycobacterium tuberculosis]
MKPYPFSAIVGHDRLRLALLLCAVRPEIGGALIRGEKGTAKSTAVRGLAALLSVATGSTETGLVELPLGATEDRVVGSLDLQRVMRDGEHAFSPGLLARAHGGVLYVDEVNLLHDHLVDILLDAAAMGRVHVERDGISHSHEARFVLIGTMNPEEGELRPQLLDRFGLTVDVQASRDIDVRVQVIRRRMAYEAHQVAALLHGFSTFDTATRIAGVILNRVGSARHEQVLRQACDQAGVAVLGAIPRTAELELPTRYLGLVTAVEYGRRARLAVQAMTAVVARHVDLAAVIACAGSQAAHPPWDPVIAVGNTARQPATVAIAAGRAFTFGYAEHAEMLRAAGAEVVEFDPLSETLPEGTDAVVLPGGFPEQFTAELSANDTVRRQINELAAAGAPVHAECAGLLYLVSELDGHPMCGVVAGSARFTQHLKLGYRDAVAVVDSALYSVGERVVGHEFHRTAVTFADSYQPAWVYQGQDVDDVRDGAVHSGVHASYLHTHPAATPGAVARFVAHAACNTPRA